MSQAYVLQRVWGIRTNNKSYLRYLLDFRASHLFIRNNYKKIFDEQSIFSYTVLKFRDKNWKEWLKYFNRYNLPPEVWYVIAPQQWRFKVSERRGGDKIFETKNDVGMNIYQQNDKCSVFVSKPSLEQTRKRNKLSRNSLLTYSYFDSSRGTRNEKFSRLGKESTKTLQSRFIRSKKGDPRNFFISAENIFLEYNLLLWLVPEFMERKDFHHYKEIFTSKTSTMRDKNREIFRNQELLRGRGLNQSIRQWRWKSKKLERNFKKLGNTASLMTFMQNQETMISLSGKMREDLNLFHLFFRRNTGIDQLTINSEHRLPRLLDDQIIMYKVASTVLKFEKRLRKILDMENIDEYFSNADITKNKEKKNLFLFNSFDLEGILLPKRCREFRVLNSLSSVDGKNIESDTNLSRRFGERDENKRIEMSRNRIIKRFIWSSYRFEDLACTNRFWFSTMNGSRFSMLRFRTYPWI